MAVTLLIAALLLASGAASLQLVKVAVGAWLVLVLAAPIGGGRE